jgi:alpha-D-xyloside xylohydrolase
MCGDALLVAPIVRANGEVEIALPPGGWYDLNSRTRYGGRQVLRYKAALDQFPVFGREGYVLPLGPAAQHTRALDAAHPIDQLWVFGKPTEPFASGQASIETRAGEAPAIRVVPEVQVQFFGDALPLGSL